MQTGNWSRMSDKPASAGSAQASQMHGEMAYPAHTSGVDWGEVRGERLELKLSGDTHLDGGTWARHAREEGCRYTLLSLC